MSTSTHHRDAQSWHEVLIKNVFVALELIAALYTRGKEACSFSHHKVLLQGLDIWKSASGRSAFEMHESCQFWPSTTRLHERHDCKTKMFWLLLAQWEQTPAVINKTSWKQEEQPVKTAQHIVVLKSAGHKLWMSIWAIEKCMLKAKTKEKGWWVFSGGTETGQELAGVAGHETNVYFYFSLKEQSRKTVSLKQTLECWSKSDLYELVLDFMCIDLISHCHQMGQDWHMSKASLALSPAAETCGKLSQGVSQAEHESLFFLWAGFQLHLSPDIAC